jgi:neutral ceramidase
MVFGSKSIQRSGDFGGYEPLVVEIAKFFRSHQPPVSAEETIEIMAFMQAADESKQQGGKPVNVPELIERTRQAGAPAKQAGGEGQWKAGVAKTIITPDQPMLMGGYAARTQPAQSKQSDLAAKALVIEDAAGRRAVLVTMDLVSIGRQMAIDVCDRIEKQYGIARPAVALSVSHNHCGPLIQGNLGNILFELDDVQRNLVERYNSQLPDRIVKLVGEAIENLAPAQLSYATGSATFAVNRRNNPEPEVPKRRAEGRLVGPVDHEVPVLRVADPAGNLRAMVFGYACHATVLNTPVWSSDWPGAGQDELERRHPGAVALFCAGCGADQNPLPRQTEEFLAIYGGQIADAVDRALAGPLQAISPRLDVAYQEIDLPFGQLPSREELEAQASGKSGTPYEARRARLLLAAWDRDGQLSPTYPYPIQLWRLGSQLDWLFLGGEVVVDYSLRLKRAAAPARLWVTAYSNDVLAYIPSRRVLAEGGYEGGKAMVYFGLPSPWDQSVEERIVDAVDALRIRLAAAR